MTISAETLPGLRQLATAGPSALAAAQRRTIHPVSVSDAAAPNPVPAFAAIVPRLGVLCTSLQVFFITCNMLLAIFRSRSRNVIFTFVILPLLLLIFSAPQKRLCFCCLSHHSMLLVAVDDGEVEEIRLGH